MHENAIACHGSIYIFIECVRAWQHDKLPWISILAFLAINRQFCVCTVYTVKAHIFVFLFPFLFPKLYSIYIYFDSSYGVCLVDICLNRRTAIKLRSRTDTQLSYHFIKNDKFGLSSCTLEIRMWIYHEVVLTRFICPHFELRFDKIGVITTITILPFLSSLE